ncbi:MAG: hypothetical protein RIT43_698 [Bacteroidota bacterium]|jgi:hypothetical protein
MKSHYDINEGTTGANGLFASIFGFIGIVLLIISLPLALISFVFCAFFALMTEGLEIRKSTNEYRKYYDFFGLRTGSWRKMPFVHLVELIPKVRKTKVKRSLPRHVGYSEEIPFNEVNLTFEIRILMGEASETFYEFNEYRNARKALDILGDCLNIPVVDLFIKQ